MSLHNAKILYLFIEITDLYQQRLFFEQGFNLKVIEIDRHLPHHHHGVVKYDAGNVILSLNLAHPKRFNSQATDGVVTVFSSRRDILAELHRINYGIQRPGNLIADLDNHLYVIQPPAIANEINAHSDTHISELRLSTNDLKASQDFYGETLDLPSERDPAGRGITFTPGTLKLTLQNEEPELLPPRTRDNTYFIVFHVHDIRDAYEQLGRRGVRFQSRPGFSEIGGTVRFQDPSGHTLLLYEPSRECLEWDSGAKVKEILS